MGINSIIYCRVVVYFQFNFYFSRLLNKQQICYSFLFLFFYFPGHLIFQIQIVSPFFEIWTKAWDVDWVSLRAQFYEISPVFKEHLQEN